MLRFDSISLVVLLVGALPTFAQQPRKNPWPLNPNVVEADPLRPERQLKKFKLPPGFEIQLVAADPNIPKPINIAFDAAGRRFVT